MGSRRPSFLAKRRLRRRRDLRMICEAARSWHPAAVPRAASCCRSFWRPLAARRRGSGSRLNLRFPGPFGNHHPALRLRGRMCEHTARQSPGRRPQAPVASQALVRPQQSRARPRQILDLSRSWACRSLIQKGMTEEVRHFLQGPHHLRKSAQGRSPSHGCPLLLPRRPQHARPPSTLLQRRDDREFRP